MILNEHNHNHHNQENIGYLHSCMSSPGVVRSSANIDLGPKNANLKFSIWASVHFESVHYGQNTHVTRLLSGDIEHFELLKYFNVEIQKYNKLVHTHASLFGGSCQCTWLRSLDSPTGIYCFSACHFILTSSVNYKYNIYIYMYI